MTNEKASIATGWRPRQPDTDWPRQAVAPLSNQEANRQKANRQETDQRENQANEGRDAEIEGHRGVEGDQG